MILKKNPIIDADAEQQHQCQHVEQVKVLTGKSEQPDSDGAGD